MDKNARILVLGSTGMLGSAIVRKLKELGHANIIQHSHRDLDLRSQSHTNYYFSQEKPDYVFMAAAKVGGILYNATYRGEFIYDNLAMCINVIHAAYENKVKKLLMLGSNCIYSKNAENPIKENALLTGELEQTNEPYAIAKIAAIKMCEAYRSQYGCNFISAMPCNLLGYNDHYDLEKSHVLPSLIMKIHNAKVNKEPRITLWGNGMPRREFLFTDDCAEACIFLMNNYDENEIVNIGSGVDFEIKEIAKMVSKIIDYKGYIVYDGSKPNGTMNKLLDTSKINKLGWFPKTTLKEAIQKTYEDFKLRL